MSRLGGLSSRDIERVAEAVGWEFSRQNGSHRVYVRPGGANNLSVPVRRDLPPGMARRLISDMGLSVDEFLRLLRP